ncbi:MAG: CDP-glycerol glycerophosphotransferase family protein [Candidatus Cloacimonetes bacterium]|nr:CDP-glycerol glycerophosphotransferase family protein [Candidatus Cloacimonadota bacterium]
MKYLLYLAKWYSVPIVEPLVEHFRTTGRDYRFYVSAKIRREFPQQWDSNLILTDLTAAKAYRPDFVLAPGNFVDFRIPGVKVQLFHGLGVEKPVHYAIRHFFDVFLTSGPYVTGRFRQLQQRWRYFDVIETGWVKLDRILSFPATGLREKYGIPATAKVILYAPTFSSNMQSASDLLPYLKTAMRDGEYWLLKFHEFMPRELIDSFRVLPPDRARIIHNEDITPYLHLADLMISDTSSVVYEFLALNKPVITYRTIDLKNKAYDITDPTLLQTAVVGCLPYPASLRQGRDLAIATVNPYLDCRTAQRITTALEQLDPSHYPKPGKPLNLIRKLQVIFHHNFKKGYLR